MFGSLSLGAIDMLRSVDMSHSMKGNEINRNVTNPIKIELRETKRIEMRPPFCLQLRACSVHIPLWSCIAERRNSRPQPPCRFRRSSGPQIVSISYRRSRYFPLFFCPRAGKIDLSVTHVAWYLDPQFSWTMEFLKLASSLSKLAHMFRTACQENLLWRVPWFCVPNRFCFWLGLVMFFSHYASRFLALLSDNFIFFFEMFLWECVRWKRH